MNESFLHLYKCRLKRAIKSVRMWIEIISLFVVYIFLFRQSGASSIFSYVCNISTVVVVFIFVDIIFAYISWIVKNNKTKKTSK